MNIRKCCKIWNTMTYRECIGNMEINSLDYHYIESIFTELKIIDVPMNGYSCENLPKTEESRVGIKRTYSDIFHTEFDKGDFTPASYLVAIINECKDYGTSKEKTIGAVARGLRTLTSLLREPDFAETIQKELIQEDINVKTNLNAKQDSGDHTDVLLTYHQQEYRIWLYQFSSRGLPHDIERLTGKRGELPDGLHLICPLHTEKAITFDKLNKKYNSLCLKLNKSKNDLDNCSKRALKKRANLQEKIQILEELITDILPLLTAEKEMMEEELDIVDGWFFYSQKYVSKVINYIRKLSTPLPYSAVVSLLTAPEEFVGKIQAFRKGC